MKNKFLILFMGIISFLGISEAKAETYTIDNVNIISSGSQNLEDVIQVYENYSNIISTMFSDMLEYYENNYSNSYPYYAVEVQIYSNDSLELHFNAYSDITQLSYVNIAEYSSSKDFLVTNSNYSFNTSRFYIRYKYENGSIISPFLDASVRDGNYYLLSRNISVINNSSNMYNYFYSNFDLIYISENASDKIIINNYPY